MKKFAIYNIKGGVGKTATATNLSYLCALEGKKTLIWDLDPQGAASFYFRTKPKIKGGTKKVLKTKELDDLIKSTEFENLDILPADFSYRNLDLSLNEAKKSKKRISILLESIEDEYDYVFLDAPPNISLVSENIFFAVDYLVVPAIPTVLSLRTLLQIEDYIESNKIKNLAVLPFFSMVDRRKNMHKETIIENKDRMLQNIIPYSSAIENMGTYQKPVGEFARNSIASRAYQDLWDEIKQKSNTEHKDILSKIFGNR
ncbi:MAG: ParA family protein [Campylobacterales bacterium]